MMLMEDGSALAVALILETVHFSLWLCGIFAIVSLCSPYVYTLGVKKGAASRCPPLLLFDLFDPQNFLCAQGQDHARHYCRGVGRQVCPSQAAGRRRFRVFVGKA